VTEGSLRATLALLLRDNEKPHASLSADAERTVRRRVGLRWAGRAGLLAVVLGLGTGAALGSVGTGQDEDLTMPSLSPTPGLTTAVATFPFEGGPEFARASSAYKCGDPAPAPHPQEHDLALDWGDQVVDGADGADGAWGGEGADAPVESPDVRTAVITQTSETNLGQVSTSGTDFLVVKDDTIVGMFYSTVEELRLDLQGGVDRYGGTELVADWVRCPDDPVATDSIGVDPGQYELIAVASVFSTPEAVALAQTLDVSGPSVMGADNVSYLENLGVLFLPGSYDCREGYGSMWPARACLADFTPSAVADAEARTVTLFYDTADLVEEFTATLVSEPLTVTLVDAEASTGWPSDADQDEVPTFETPGDLTCGASGVMTYSGLFDDGLVAEVTINQGNLDSLLGGGTFPAEILPYKVADGSRVELLPGAQLVSLAWSDHTATSDDESTWTSSVQTVTRIASVSLDGYITSDRYAGPQPASVTVGPASSCATAESPSRFSESTDALIAGTWRITAPDGQVTTHEVITVAQFGPMYGG